MVIYECPDDQDDDKKQITPYRINKGVIHKYIEDNEKETNRDTSNKVIEEFPDDTTPYDMKECGNDEEMKNTA